MRHRGIQLGQGAMELPQVEGARPLQNLSRTVRLLGETTVRAPRHETDATRPQKTELRSVPSSEYDSNEVLAGAG